MVFSTKETLDGRFGDDTAQETGTHHVLSSSCSQVPGDIRFVPPAQGLRLRSGMIPDEQPAIEDVFSVAGTDVVNVLPPLFFLRRPKKGNQREGRIETHGRAGGGWMAIFRVSSAKAITRAWAVGVLSAVWGGWMELPCTSMACRIWKGTLAVSVGDLAGGPHRKTMLPLRRVRIKGRETCRVRRASDEAGADDVVTQSPAGEA